MPVPDHVVRSFRHFAGFCEDRSPLYAAMSTRCLEDETILALSSHGQPRQPPVNLLFGAVHFLLLRGERHALADFYPSVGGDRRDPAAAWPLFQSFCRTHAEAIQGIVATRRVQTNEVGRCGVLLPAFASVHATFDRPLHLVEIGPSAGLNLLFDRYGYEYSGGRRSGRRGSEVTIRTTLAGAAHPPPEAIPPGPPPVAGRVGIDMSPVDVTDDDAMRWVEALIWADDVDRVELQRAAVIVARRDPPTIRSGDGLEDVATLVDAVPQDRLPCVFHSHAIYQMPREWRAAFDDALDAIGRRRDLAHVSLEWLGDDASPRLSVTRWSDGVRDDKDLAMAHHHGRWLRWVDDGAGSAEDAMGDQDHGASVV